MLGPECAALSASAAAKALLEYSKRGNGDMDGKETVNLDRPLEQQEIAVSLSVVSCRPGVGNGVSGSVEKGDRDGCWVREGASQRRREKGTVTLASRRYYLYCL